MSTALNQALSPGTVIAYAGIRPTTWRNGGGVTRQLVSGKLAHAEKPEASSGDDWDWRLSIAEVESEGPFSAFVGMSRILTVIEGEGLAITIDGVEQRLDRYMPLRFDGGAATSATLPAGPIRDLQPDYPHRNSERAGGNRETVAGAPAAALRRPVRRPASGPGAVACR